MKNASEGIHFERVWGSTIYHIDDLTMDPAEIAPQYTKFRKLSEGTPIRPIIPEPAAGYLPFTENPSEVITSSAMFMPTLTNLGFTIE